MTGIPRTLGLLLLGSAVSAPVMASSLTSGFATSGFGLPSGAVAFSIRAVSIRQDVNDTFQEGVDLLNRGRDAEALVKFQQVLAADPSHEAAYELWKTTDHDVWLELLVKGGDFELIAKDMMSRVESARAEQMDDADAIRALIQQLGSDDPREWRSAVRQLSAAHGEYAVRYMLGALADQDDGNRRVLVTQALTEMDTTVVLPLIAALDSSDAFLRRNIAYLLGYIGDTRATAALASLTADPEVSVQNAANDALGRLGAEGRNAGNLYTQMGEAYLTRSAAVLRPYQYSDVVWSWDGGDLVATPVARSIYADELAKQAFHRALELNPDSDAARAGLVRAYVSQVAKAERLGDGADFADSVNEGMIAVNLAGVDAIDGALGDALAAGQSDTAIGLCRLLGASCMQPTAGLEAALGSGDAAVRAEAGLALGQIAISGRSAPGADVVANLGTSVGREVVRIVGIIDPNENRSAAMVQALEAQGIAAYAWNKGALGVAMLHRVPGVDLVVVASSLPDLTTHQVIDDIERNPATADSPIVVLSADLDSAEDSFPDADGYISSLDDMGTLEDLLQGGMNSDREQADAIAASAARILDDLATAGADIGGAHDALVSVIGLRPDAVAVPAMAALETMGGASAIAPLIGVAAGDDRSDEARAQACAALAAVFSRGGTPTEAGLAQLNGILGSDAALAVRAQAARAIGALGLSGEQRGSAIGSARVNVGG